MSMLLLDHKFLPEWSSVPLLGPYSELILVGKPALSSRALQAAHSIMCINNHMLAVIMRATQHGSN